MAHVNEGMDRDAGTRASKPPAQRFAQSRTGEIVVAVGKSGLVTKILLAALAVVVSMFGYIWAQNENKLD